MNVLLDYDTLQTSLSSLISPPSSITASVVDRVLHVSGKISDKEGSRVNIFLHRFVEANSLLGQDRKRLAFYKTKERKVEEHRELSVPDSDLVEEVQSKEEFEEAVDFLAAWIAKHKGKTVFHTGAGISTAAKIPDFRGQNGVWTRRDRGLPPPKSIPLTQAIPTFTHRCIKKLLLEGIASHLVSQNVDGLHLRSGVPQDKISELHGNCFMEKCATCNTSFLRSFDASHAAGPFFRRVPDTLSESGINHITGRKCDSCKVGMLRDTIIHFRESLPEEALKKAERESRRAKLCLAVGTSLHVTPAADIPELCSEADGIFAIVSTHSTGKDLTALYQGGIIVHCKADDFFQALMNRLGFEKLDQTKEAKKAEEELIETTREELGNADFFQVAEESASQQAPPKSNNFFSFIGLQSSMLQLPPQLEVNQVNDQEKKTWQVTLSPPKEWPLPLQDMVEKVTFSLEGFQSTLHSAPFSTPNRSFALDTEGSFLSVQVFWNEDFGVSPTAFIHTISFSQPSFKTCVKCPQLKIHSGIKDSILSQHGTLKPTETRVRRLDGSVFVEERDY